MADGTISKIQLPDNTIYDVVDNASGYMTGMTILSYGNSTWQNFIDAYSSNQVVYCRASSNSNPASGSQTRLAFMAYVNNATTPTEVEFQYYRSVSTHTASQQGDQVYVYKLNKTNGWSVTVREASVKVVAGTGLGGTYRNNTMTLTGPTKVSDLTNDSGFITDAGVTSVNGNTGAVTVTEGLAPLIGTTSTITPQQVMTALGEGRDICISASYTFNDIPLSLNFTAFNRAVDTVYSGQALDVVASQTIVNYNNTPLIFMLLGGISNGSAFTWEVSFKVIPANISDLTNDSNFVADASYVHTDNNYTSTEKTKLSGIAAGAEVNVQSDWNNTTSSSDAFIKNKPLKVTKSTVDGEMVYDIEFL